MNNRKIISIFVAIIMILGSYTVSFADDATASTTAAAAPPASTAGFADITGHWGAAAIEKWAGYRIISGFEGQFRPDDSITRGEMAVILDNMMDYQKTAANTFNDLQAGQFYTDAVLKANAAGIIKGDGVTVRPLDKITKEEAAVMLSRAFAVSTARSTKAFKDASSVSEWAKGAVFGMESKGYVSGFEGNFNPKANITRAEAVTMINNIVKAYYTVAGTYNDKVDGTAVIKVSDVILKGVTVSENLIIAEGVGQGDATLDSVTVKGDTVVRGGGENSVHITGNSNITSVKIEKVGDKVRITVTEGSTVKEVEVADGEEIIITGKVGSLEVSATGATVLAADAEIAAASILGDNSKIVVDSDSKITNLTIADTAENTKVQTEAGATVQTVTASAEVSVTGTGTVASVILNAGADGSQVTTPNTATTVSTGVTGVTGGGGVSIPAGSTGTNSSTGTGTTVKPTTPPPSGGSGGGSSSNNNNNNTSPTFNFGNITINGVGEVNYIPRAWSGATTMSAIVSGTNLAGKTLTVEVSANVVAVGTITSTYTYAVKSDAPTSGTLTFNSTANNAGTFVTGFNSAALLADWNTLNDLDIVGNTITITVKYGSTTIATKALTVEPL